MIRAAALSLFLAAGALAAPPDEEVDATTAGLAAEPATIPGLPPGPPPPADEVDALAHDIGTGLRCPVCQGLSVADSTSPTAVLIQKRVRELVAAGYTEVEIHDYFISKYGEWILLNPTANGINRVVWIGPALAVAVGLIIAGTFLRSGSAPAASPDPRSADPADPWTKRLLDEVDDD